jgi:hypothetical protein
MSLLHTIKEQEKEFDKNIPKSDDRLFSKKESDPYHFGHKVMEGDEIFTITDWSRIKKFHRTSLIAIFEENIKRITEIKEKITVLGVTNIGDHFFQRDSIPFIESELTYYQHLLEGLREE